MKKLIGSILFAAFAISSIAQASITPERLLRNFTLNAQREFNGNFEGIDDFTLSHHGRLVFRQIQDRFIVTMVSNGNRHAWRSNLVYPKAGNVKFSVPVESDMSNPNSVVEYKTYLYDFEGELLPLTLAPKDKTFYIIESDAQYERRLKQLAKLGNYYEITGKYFGIAEFSAHRIEKIDFYEIVPDSMETTTDEATAKSITTEQVILRGTYSAHKNTRYRHGGWGHGRW